ncbi:hypothetical protein GCM10022631_32050 [Deinococcus rubellus]|uniref:Uncharacterized protein n=1 Tax=Deinococcus rubellus TaxID=1889240 RepID=A0ABY5YI21_9DEIO|nr:hypothetical protein [Deinococcus rubellus]UWX64714.1 hypothetical protein N0D28_03380 [Deinococcus rubellus]
MDPEEIALSPPDVFASKNPAFNEKLPRIAFEVWIDLLLGRDNKLIDIFFKGPLRARGTYLKEMKRRIFKMGMEVDHHYAGRLAQRRAEHAGYTVNDRLSDFEGTMIYGSMWDLPAPVAFESKWVMDARSVSYRVHEYIYQARAHGAGSCMISFYDALGVLDWDEMARLAERLFEARF